MFNTIANKLLQEYLNSVSHISPPTRGPSAIMDGPLPAGFKGSGVAGIAPGKIMPLKINKKKIKKKKA